jgi:ABC-2 type transport system permease protein
VAAYIQHMTGNWLISGGVELIGAAVCVITYIMKAGLFENILKKILGNLALANFFTDITSNNIVNISGIILYLSIIVVFIFLTIQTIQRRRWS